MRSGGRWWRGWIEILFLPGLRTCPITDFEKGRPGFMVSHPFAKSANGSGTERWWRVDSGQIPVFGQILRVENRGARPCFRMVGARGKVTNRTGSYH